MGTLTGKPSTNTLTLIVPGLNQVGTLACCYGDPQSQDGVGSQTGKVSAISPHAISCLGFFGAMSMLTLTELTVQIWSGELAVDIIPG